MLYYLFDYLHETFSLPGAGVFRYLSFRAAMAALLSLWITIVYGKTIIEFLRKKQVGETIRDLGLDGQMQKKGTPTMGGLIIIAAILIPTLLFAKLNNIYIILMIVTTIWLGFIGFLDDYIKVFRKNKQGLQGKFKVVGQIGLGLIIGLAMYFSPSIVISEPKAAQTYIQEHNMLDEEEFFAATEIFHQNVEKSTKTTIPFVKHNEFDYAWFVNWMGDGASKYTWIIFVFAVIFIITAVSNGANLTDGIDGLATGTSAIIGTTLAILAWVSGNIVFANYLNIMYIPNVGELVIFISAFIGATVGFLWYNTYPAQVFMGDTGSLTIGGIIAVFAILIRKELLLPVLCGIFFMESLSVMMQVSYFKYTKKKYGEGRRIFKMSPLHHHYQVNGFAEPKIVMRFFIIGILLAILSIVTLKLR
ncbi:MAG: phospho-N-acetylmuramoyl-pentapeptide-transferase [Bacteroidales bacterium]|jgi:phospho-N-acetylmuramoyl-pentapeptide-transferase|nr:phospho-N-acetylmuramoyl-pentapeptide-transferase [Bacteroidales bacterium]